MSDDRSFETLAAQGFVLRPTLEVLRSRIEEPIITEPSFLDPSVFETLVALCDRVKPLYDQPGARSIALQIDARLGQGERGGDGWRYAALPTDGEAYRLGLAAIEAEAELVFGRPFAQVSGEQADALIRSMQRGETKASEWKNVPAKPFFEETLVEVIGIAYSYPQAQAAIGYVGYADAKGWKRIGLNEREEWER